MFYIGQPVLCVNDTPGHTAHLIRPGVVARNDFGGLTAGVIYTVRKVGLYANGGVREHLALWLVEIDRGLDPQGAEYGFAATRFRPVVERETDISALKALLNPSREEVEV